MAAIVPAILARSPYVFKRFVEKTQALAPALVHLDVMDGVFVPTTTWVPKRGITKALGGLAFEVHLMVADPAAQVFRWLDAGADRVIFHVEAVEDATAIVELVGDRADKLSLAINPDTPFTRLLPCLEAFRQFMVMGVNPGASGQPFQPEALEKLRKLREAKPEAHITLDGGASADNATDIARAGASAIISASAIFKTKDPKDAYAQLQELAK
jgi:ribulose-phosphate 3-epimerase